MSLKRESPESLAVQVADAARLLGLSINTVRNKIRAGILRAVLVGGKQGGRYLITREEIARFLREGG